MGQASGIKRDLGAFGGRVEESAFSENARYIARLEAEAKAMIPERLKALMAERELSAPMLSRRSHVAINTVYGTIAGGTTPRLGNLIALAVGLGVSLDQLIGASAIEQLAVTAGWPSEADTSTVSSVKQSA